MFSPEVKEWLTLLLAFGTGVSSVVGLALLPILYFRLTRKYDAMFPDHDDLTDGIWIQGDINRTGRYMWCIVRKNLSQRNERIRRVTGGYDFRGNAPLLDIILCYLLLFFGLSAIGGMFTIVILTEIFGIDL
ncbi:MAG TPA: hypothetical protein ENI94_04200 [Gammaproteobacteria bacterium]|nr:hypothetical protein [Gammaproteobacteria bacterium]